MYAKLLVGGDTMKKALVSALMIVAAVVGSVAFTGSVVREGGNDNLTPRSCCLDEISTDG